MLAAAGRQLLIAALATACAIALADVTSAARSVKQVLRLPRPPKPIEPGLLLFRDIRSISQTKNVPRLLEYAEQRGRINELQMRQLSSPYIALRDGDLLLQQCLKRPACKPGQLLQAAQKTELHFEVVGRSPELNLTRVNDAAGEISEHLMVHFFEASGWKRVEGQIGRQGFDGLFVKYDGDGKLKDVLVVESKYNTSQLKSTSHGIQMSDEWVRRKVVELIERHPDEAIYRQLAQFVDEDKYRARLWNMTVKDGAMEIELQRVRSKGGIVELSPADDVGVEQPPSKINLSEPRNGFERDLADRYNEELAAYGPPIPRR